MKHLWPILFVIPLSTIMLISCLGETERYPFNSEWKKLPLLRKYEVREDGTTTQQTYFSWNDSIRTTFVNQGNNIGDTTHIVHYDKYGNWVKSIHFQSNQRYSIDETEFFDGWKRSKRTITYLDPNNQRYNQTANYFWNGLTRTTDESNTTRTYNEYGNIVEENGYITKYLPDGRRPSQRIYPEKKGCEKVVYEKWEWNGNKGIHYTSPRVDSNGLIINCDDPIGYQNKIEIEINADYLIVEQVVYPPFSRDSTFSTPAYTRFNDYEYDNPFSVIKN